MKTKILSGVGFLSLLIAVGYGSYWYNSRRAANNFQVEVPRGPTAIPKGYRSPSSQPELSDQPAGSTEFASPLQTDISHAPQAPRVSIRLSERGQRSSTVATPPATSAQTEPQPRSAARDLPKPAPRNEPSPAKATPESTPAGRARGARTEPETTQPRDSRLPERPRTNAPSVDHARTSSKSDPLAIRSPHVHTREKPTDTQSTAPPTEMPYRVIVGTFESEENSKNLASQLSKKGYYTFTNTKVIGGKTFYRVQVGAFADRERAEQLKRDLESQGIPASVSK